MGIRDRARKAGEDDPSNILHKARCTAAEKRWMPVYTSELSKWLSTLGLAVAPAPGKTSCEMHTYWDEQEKWFTYNFRVDSHFTTEGYTFLIVFGGSISYHCFNGEAKDNGGAIQVRLEGSERIIHTLVDLDLAFRDVEK